ncbi:MAG: hypothetical protein NXI20_05935 [bacterium]|nr:hypothetical protein [bacterium]
MNKVKIHILFIVTILLLSPNLTRAVQTDSLVNRGFDQERLSSLNESSRYDYDRKFEQKEEKELNAAPNLIGRIFAFFARLFTSVIGYVVLILLVGGLIWIIVKNVRLPKKKFRVKSEDVLNYDPEQDIQLIDYTGLLEDAIANRNYRLAIRYLYIITLQKLQTAELIQWHKEKTNRDYYYELPQDYQPTFNDILRIYEYVWYGEFDASESLFGKMRVQIDILDSKTSEIE